MLRERPSKITKDVFLKTYGNVYEHSPWIAEAAWEHRETGNLDQPDALFAVMQQAVEQGTVEQQLALICAHPDLAVAPAELSKLTDASQSEQSGAGLKQCSPEEFQAFQQLNADYKAKFGFPFIVAVKGLNRHEILAQFRSRIQNEREEEFRTALDQIHKIAKFRLQALAQ